MTAIVSGIVLLLLALALGAGGAWLVALGGSWAYLILALPLAASGVLLIRRRRAALAVYAVLLAGAAVWGLWEVGLDRWQLVPRGALFAAVGLWLLTPWVTRSLEARGGGGVDAGADGGAGQVRDRSRTGLALMVVGAVAIALLTLRDDPARMAGTLPGPAPVPVPVATGGPGAALPAADDWPAYGGNGAGQRYSALADITPQTVSRLRRAWTFHTGGVRTPDDPKETTLEVTPLKIGDMLVVCSPASVVFALDAATGRELWRFDPQVVIGAGSQHKTCRGLGYHDAGAAAGAVDAAAATGAASTAATAVPAVSAATAAPPNALAPAPSCSRRLLLPTVDARLIALDAATGRRCAGFGDRGVVDLKTGMPNLRPGSYMQTSPPVVTRRLVIVGGSINDNVAVDNPSGVIRAFDVDDGSLVWQWHASTPGDTAPLPDGQPYPPGGPNMWSVASVDEALGLVYLPMANRSPDLVGTRRGADVERYTSSMLALDIGSGRERWVFQTVHHDLWDRDVPSQPTLVDLTVGGRVVPALIAPTKQGDLYVLDRRDGTPVFPVRRRSVPTDAVDGERPSPVQPSSSLSFMPPPLTARDMWGATPLDQLWCRIRFARLRYEGPYTPPTEDESLVYPGNTGVFNWGGIAVDPVRQWLVASPVRLAFTHRLVPRRDPQAHVVTDGQRPFNENYGGRWAFAMQPFVSPLGLPCQAPPWGLLAGVDLRTGQVAWQRRNGTVRDSLPPWLPLPLPMGVPALGGPLLTAGGVVFYSGTLDQFLRAYDAATGEQLWQARLPAGGQATPMTYRAGGRQMVVVAAGGHGTLGTKAGDAIVAFTLDEPAAPAR